MAAEVQPQDLADLLQYATDMITTTDIGGTCTFASPAAMSMMGILHLDQAIAAPVRSHAADTPGRRARPKADDAGDFPSS